KPRVSRKWIGIDFSGSNPSWSSGTSRSNVWIATLKESSRRRLQLVGLVRVQNIQPISKLSPFDSLAEFLRTGSFDCAAIDAPFSLPLAAMPEDGFRALLKLVSELPLDSGRHIPRGAQLLEIARRRIETLPKDGDKNYRRLVEQIFGATRTPLWNGPRPGAPFTVTCLRLMSAAGVTSLWAGNSAKRRQPRLVEAYPARQLKAWGIENKKYDGKKGDAPSMRHKILSQIRAMWRVKIDGSDEQLMLDSADALDALICAFAARAAYLGIACKPPKNLDPREGWIAIHPRPLK
ncbi:unnamed protein product, partial [Phaeothamnion confervicola]